MRSPVIWFGGKGMLVKKLIPYIPKHRTYVEPFGGGASLLFAKEPSEVEVYNDIHSGVVNLFRVIRDNFDEFYRKVSMTPYSREEFYYCRDNWINCENDIDKAYMFFVKMRQSFSGTGRSWCFRVTSKYLNWLSTIDMLPEIHQRLMHVYIEHKDFRDIIKTYDTPETFFYLDPPYIKSTRKNGKYDYETSDKDHHDLVDMLLNIKGKAMLSGYRNPIYNTLEEAGWQRIDIETVCNAAGRTRYTKILGEGAAKEKQKRVESLWLSYNNKEDWFDSK